MDVAEALERGREDIPFFAHYFCKRKLHDSQVQWVTGSQATINILATGNRWGKTSALTVQHLHAGVYKTGAEHRYVAEDGSVDLMKMVELPYHTAHAAGLSDLMILVWRDALSVIRASPYLKALVDKAPLSQPPEITFITGAVWMFRTLADDASSLDGKSFYLITLDEAGWLTKLQEMMDNVLKIRVADVRGRICIVGTMKPGDQSRDFLRYAVRASAYTGADVVLEHGAVEETDLAEPRRYQIDPSIYKYAEEIDVNLNELLDACSRGARR